MHAPPRVMAVDRTLIQIVDTAMAEAVRRGGDWVVCRPGCAECCLGPFPITQLDAARLLDGLAELAARDPGRAAQVRERARQSVARLAEDFPGDAATGALDDSEESEERFATLAEDEPCPALDPATGTCDLYEARPVTCRMFGPAVRSAGDALGVCELCYRGASEAEIAACAVDPDPGRLEEALLGELEKTIGRSGRTRTVVAYALAAEF